MYSPNLLAYLIIGIRYITEVGGKFSILTATLPELMVDLLREENINFVMPDKPFIDETYNRHSLKVIEKGINVGYIIKNYKKNKVLVIGDQLFTDIWGGNKMGLNTALVTPRYQKEFFYTKIIRKIERKVLKILQISKKDVSSNC